MLKGRSKEEERKKGGKIMLWSVGKRRKGEEEALYEGGKKEGKEGWRKGKIGRTEKAERRKGKKNAIEGGQKERIAISEG